MCKLCQVHLPGEDGYVQSIYNCFMNPSEEEYSAFYVFLYREVVWLK